MSASREPQGHRFTTELIVSLVVAFGSGAGVYAAIRADLTQAILTAQQAYRLAEKAHDRLDARQPQESRAPGR